MRRYVYIAACLVCLSTLAVGDMALIDDVPSYEWYHGCGPSAAGMIIGYWDGHGFDDLIDGSNSWFTNEAGVKAMIASEGHIRDYVPDPDRVGTPEDPLHEDDCVADFMYASRYPLAYGVSFAGWQYFGMARYAEYRGYENVVGNSVQYGDLWEVLVGEIDSARPMELYVDRSGDGDPDHFVAAIGYDDGPDGKRYAAYNTYDHAVHWYDFVPPTPGQAWAVRSGTWFAMLPWEPVGVRGDFDGNGLVDAEDIDLLYDTIYGAVWFDLMYDLNGDGVATVADMDIMVGDLVQLTDGTAGTAYGDANLDGVVNLDDFQALKRNFALPFGGWAEGNYDGDSDVDLDDFVVLSQNFGYVGGGTTGEGGDLPEPATALLLAAGAMIAARRRRT